MSLSILLSVTILFTVSIAALGQNSMSITECMNAGDDFLQESSCFGSDEGMTGFLSTLNSNGSFLISAMQEFDNPIIQRTLRTFYNNFCASQHCVNVYAAAIERCSATNLTQNIPAALLVDQYVDYACATNENGEYCAIAQLENFDDHFNNIVLCSLGWNLTGSLCANTCDDVRRARASTGCCINSYLEYFERLLAVISGFADVSLPDTSGIFTDCGVTDPGMCTTTLSNPLTSSGDHHLVHSWWLLAGVLVSVKVIIMG